MEIKIIWDVLDAEGQWLHPALDQEAPRGIVPPNFFFKSHKKRKKKITIRSEIVVFLACSVREYLFVFIASSGSAGQTRPPSLSGVLKSWNMQSNKIWSALN